MKEDDIVATKPTTPLPSATQNAKIPKKHLHSKDVNRQNISITTSTSPLLTTFDSGKLLMPRPLFTRKGIGYASGHHGELLQGEFTCQDGQISKGLVTVKCPLFNSVAIFKPIKDAQNILAVPETKHKARKAACHTLDYLGFNNIGGHLQIYGNTPEKFGLGSSTSDVIASIKAVANALGKVLDSNEIAKLAVDVEKASDSTMYSSNSILFAQRKGEIIERFQRNLPPIEIIGFNSDKTEKGIDTLAMPTINYTKDEIEQFGLLRKLFRIGIARKDLQLIGSLATQSADISQKYLPKPDYASFKKIVELTGGIGLQVSHSGTVVGLMFDKRKASDLLEKAIKKCKSLLAELGYTHTWQFSVH